MFNIWPEDFKDMVRAGAKAASARGANDAREATPQTGPQGPPPNGREEVDELSAANDDFQHPHALIVGDGEDPATLLLKAGSEPDLVNNVYLQCETAVPFNNIRVHVFDPADGSSHFLPRTGAADDARAVLSRALDTASDLLIWALVDRRPEAVEAHGEGGLDLVDEDSMPCNRHHASALRRAASLMHSGMLTPAEEVRSQMSDLLDDGLKKEGFSLSEVMSKVVTPAAGTEARSAHLPSSALAARPYLVATVYSLGVYP